MDRYLRGTLNAGETRKLLIDDGDFQHGFVIDDFKISQVNPLNGAASAAVAAILHLTPTGPVDFLWRDPTQIGWAVYDGNPTNLFHQIAPDNIVVRELYVTNVNATDQCNYMVHLCDRSLTPAHGVLTMVKEVTYND
jgi:hypothetical protein